jgi:3-oxoacyl-[acyl-carrier-protein] synthase-3
MAFLQAFGCHLPSRVVGNEEMETWTGAGAQWIRDVSGIEQRRFAGEDQTVASLGALAARECLERAGVAASELGMILLASGSSERRFPGPAAVLARMLGLDSTPAIDLPLASAGALAGMYLASRLAASVGLVLVVASEKMSSVALRQPVERGVAVLFGDGAGACLINPSRGMAEVIGSVMHTDGAYAEALKLEFDQPLAMDGRSVILQASRKLPRVISEVLEGHGISPAAVDVFLLHQANRNLIVRVAQALGVPEEKFFSNIARLGNTSSASMLIAAAEWERLHGFRPGVPVCFAAFGAGFHWGALLAKGCL